MNALDQFFSPESFLFSLRNLSSAEDELFTWPVDVAFSRFSSSFSTPALSPSSLLWLRTLCHGVPLAIMIAAYKNLEKLKAAPFIRKQKGGHWQYLTNFGLVGACIAMVLALSLDLRQQLLTTLGSEDYESDEHDLIMQGLYRKALVLCLPLVCAIALVYWTFFLLLPKLIINGNPVIKAIIETTPKSKDGEDKNIDLATIAASATSSSSKKPSSGPMTPEMFRLPLHMDLALHLVPVTALLTDFFLLQSRRFTEVEMWHVAPLGIVIEAVAYATWSEYCASFNKTFPYPFLAGTPFVGRAGLYVVVASIGMACLTAVNAIHA